MFCQISSVVSWCTHCFVRGHEALTIKGRGAKTGECLQCKRNSPEAAKFHNSIFSPLQMPFPAQCRPGHMPLIVPFPPPLFSVVLNTFETGQLQIRKWVETRNKTNVLSCRQFSSHHQHGQDKTRQFCLVRVGSVK